MEPSRTEELIAELARRLRASRNEESYLPLSTLAELVSEALDTEERLLLAKLLIMYEQDTPPAEARA